MWIPRAAKNEIPRPVSIVGSYSRLKELTITQGVTV